MAAQGDFHEIGLQLRQEGRDDAGCGRLEQMICISSAGMASRSGAIVDCSRSGVMRADRRRSVDACTKDAAKGAAGRSCCCGTSWQSFGRRSPELRQGQRDDAGCGGLLKHRCHRCTQMPQMARRMHASAKCVLRWHHARWNDAGCGGLRKRRCHRRPAAAGTSIRTVVADGLRGRRAATNYAT